MKKTRENKNKNTRLKDLNSQKAITLIALVVTIVVLLILAGVSLSLVLGENGIINKAKEAGDKYGEATKNEQLELEKVDEWLEENTGSLYKPMITKWNIEAGNEVTIYLYYPMNYDNPVENTTNVTIDWGDNEKETYTKDKLKYNGLLGYVTHTYQNSNSETVIEILGECNTINTYSPQLISIEDWGYTGSSYYDFRSCDNLTTIASPRSNTFKNVISFDNTFSRCSNLTTIPADLFANCPQVTNFKMTFSKCTSITTIPEDLFANCTQVTNFYNAFSECTSLTTIPADLFANCTQVTSFNGIFDGCTGLTNIPENLFANCTQVTNFEMTFSKCTSITTIPENLFANCTQATNFCSTFASCSNLISIPADLFANCTQVTNFNSTFNGCTNLTGEAITLWERVENGAGNGYQGNPDGGGCYYGCTKLTNYDVIPEYWKSVIAPS